MRRRQAFRTRDQLFFRITCDKCHRQADMVGVHVLPDGWERFDGDDFCAECMRDKWWLKKKRIRRRKSATPSPREVIVGKLLF